MCLIGIGKMNDSFEMNNQQERRSLIKRQICVNPGPNYLLQANDTCFYISLVKEENFETILLKMKIRKSVWGCWGLNFKFILKQILITIMLKAPN